MNVGIVNTWLPFVSGGAELLARSLRRQLRARGHGAMLVKVPFRWHPPEAIVESMVAATLLDLSRFDKVIALKFPAYLAPHPDKSIWLLHQFRQVYELWGTPYQDLPDTDAGRRVRDIVREADAALFAGVSRVFTNSAVTASRLREWSGREAAVLLPPHPDPGMYSCADYGDFVLCPGRITGGKRQHLAVEAMRYVRTPVRLIVAGAGEQPADVQRLRSLVEEHGLHARVEIRDRFIADEEKAELHSRSLACVYLPWDEDSYGYVTMEAFLSCKPVVTCWDSGGVLSLVENEVTGLVMPPQPQDIAVALDRLFEHRALAVELGEAGRERVESLGLEWDHVIGELLG